MVVLCLETNKNVILSFRSPRLHMLRCSNCDLLSGCGLVGGVLKDVV